MEGTVQQFPELQHYPGKQRKWRQDYQVLVDVPAKRASIVNGLKTGDFVNVKGKCVGIVNKKSPTLISVQIKSTKINDQDAD